MHLVKDDLSHPRIRAYRTRVVKASAVEQVRGLRALPMNRTIETMRVLKMPFIRTPGDAARLADALETDLGEAYEDEVFSTSADEFAEAEAKFDEGRVANANGDAFSLAGVIFTIALFFAGLALVFKTHIRWTFFGAGAFVFLASCVYLATLTWTR